VLVALAIALVSIDAGMGVFWTLPSTFLSASAAAGGIALIRTIGALGGLAGPYLVGFLRQASGDYSSAMAGLGGALMLSAVLVLALGRALPSRRLQLS
jgi:ACS family tartrate transporter-like MFS transporter